MIKQIIVIRRDLKMDRGKVCAQVAHASIAFLTARLSRTRQAGQTFYEGAFSDAEAKWIKGSFAKICVRAESEQELLDLHQQAQDAGLVSHLIQDSGRTVFHDVPTYTCLGIGPDHSERIDKVTGSLKLY